MRLIPRRRGLRPELGTFVLGGVATALAAAVVGGELWRVRRGGLGADEEPPAEHLTAAAAVAETAAIARSGYGSASPTENALFNLFTSFVTSLITVRGVTTLLRRRRSVGPFRNVVVGERHIHHFVPGIVLAFVAGSVSVATRRESLDRWLAIPFGAGMGLTLDESALLLELDDVYWSEEGIVSVQIALAVTAMLSAVALATRFLRRGERIVLEDPAR